ncbi:type 1 glutamine amidotransferase [Hazenella sp. IB182353]|uniref:type 1 glutamine amidotransferase n=1 Tax=Polycladospora coralii TaxID=2771432 RepID=UPI001746D3A2|nr:type 1 glutamine amidotransferase [Polycladospora coralii]MBS7532005.1 type 1 glutamine amidotransferase [Polycladospora coralii]
MSKPLRIHYVQHVPFEGLGAIEHWAHAYQHRLSSTPMYETVHHFPNITDIDWLIVMGGPMGVSDDAVYPWLKAEKDFIRKAIDADKKVLGICLGSQLIADVLGAKVYRGKEKEIGWFPIIQTQEAIQDPIFKGLPTEMNVFHWHGDVAEVPTNAVCLATSPGCPNQIFRYGEHVWGLQFHFEMTEKTIQALIKNCAQDLAEPGRFMMNAIEIQHQAKNNLMDNQKWLYHLLHQMAIRS